MVLPPCVEENHVESDSEENHKQTSSLTADEHDADHTLENGDHGASLIDDDNLMLNTSSVDNNGTPTVDNAQSENLTLQSTDQEEQLNFSDLIHDEEHNDLSTLIQAGPQSDTAEGPAEVEHVPAEGGEIAGTEGYDAGNDTMLDSLIAKPEEHA